MLYIFKWFFFLLLPFSKVFAEYTIAIQPFGPFDSALAASLIPEIRSQFDNPKVIILKSVPLPQKAYYKPRNRYRAEILLAYLDSLRNGRYTKIFGLTQKDISTTKGEYPDWGIFGFGSINGGPCVVSIYRLRRKTNNRKLSEERFLKVVIHELGHTCGLYHCGRETCVMADYKGTMKSLDITNKSSISAFNKKNY